jgi:hypothetical protein
MNMGLLKNAAKNRSGKIFTKRDNSRAVEAIHKVQKS